MVVEQESLKDPAWSRAAGILNGSTIPVVLNGFIILCERLPQRREDKSGKIIPVLLSQKLFPVITRDIIIQTLATFCSESRNVSSWLGLRVKLSATTKQQAYPGTPGHFVDYLDTNEGKIFGRPTCQELFVFLTEYHHELTLKSAIRG
jgi:predicted nucleic-acid-binding protein